MFLSRKEFLKLAASAGAATAGGFFSFLDAPHGFAEDVLRSGRLRKIHDHIARQILNQEPRHCNYVGNPEVGAFLESMQRP